MKILIVQDRLRSGGTERQSVLLANAFTAAGHPTTLLTFRPGGALNTTVSAHVERRALQPFDLRLDWFAPRLAGTVAALRPEVILCMGRMANCYGAALTAISQQFSPTAVVIATMRTGKKLPWLFRRSLRRARHIVANSHEARTALISTQNLPPEKISVIYNSLVFPASPSAASPVGGVPPPRSDSARVSLRVTHGATESTTVLVNVAMFRPEKNQRELLHLAAQLPRNRDWQLWLAGDGPERLPCERLAKDLQLIDRIRFLNFQRDPAPLYAAADVAVHASTSESLSNFLIEAQAHGLPAVAYAAQGIGECFVPHRTGWAVPIGDRTGFLAALQPLFQPLPEVRAFRSAEARAFARTTFDPARQVAAYLDLFAQLTSPTP